MATLRATAMSACLVFFSVCARVLSLPCKVLPSVALCSGGEVAVLERAGGATSACCVLGVCLPVIREVDVCVCRAVGTPGAGGVNDDMLGGLRKKGGAAGNGSPRPRPG